MEEQQSSTRLHQIQLETAVPALEGYWDPLRLERVVTNLLSNAIKYSPDPSTITVTVRQEQDAADGRPWASVTVEDEGIGIPSADLPHIFARFRRGSNVPQRTPGAGIGLAARSRLSNSTAASLVSRVSKGVAPALLFDCRCSGEFVQTPSEQ